MRLYAIGDVHGYSEPLRRMHRMIEDDLKSRPAEDWRIIHVGDYVDRGPDSKGVIDFLLARMAGDERILALRGNHDQGFLDFLDEPDPGGIFVHNGGEETARSYGVPADFSDEAGFSQSARLLTAAMPAVHRRFLNSLVFTYSFGDYFFCHAGIMPGVPLRAQREDTLIWIREPFLNWGGLFEKVVVHGHTPVEDVDMQANRVNVDTGVFVHGRLSALVLEGDEKTVMTVTV